MEKKPAVHIPVHGSYLLVTGSILLIMALGLFLQYRAHFKWAAVAEKGIITVAKVVKYDEANDNGPEIYLEIYLKDSVLKTKVRDDCDECTGSYLFVKILRDDPLRYPLLYKEEQVPDCILFGKKYFEGWDELPECDKKEKESEND